MGLVTRCPACGTMFKVVSDQLKVSGGWVRCGQCAEVFDAQLYLQNQADFTVHQNPQAETSVDFPVSDQVLEHQSPLAADQQQLNGLRAEDVAPLESESSGFATLAANTHLKPDADDPLVTHAQNPNLEVAAGGVPEAVFKDVSFVRHARRQVFWRSPLLRWALALFALILLCLLTVQVAVHQQSAVLAFEPRLRPLLQQICRDLACDIGLSKRIEAIVIDSSSFNKANDSGGFRLSFVLRNTDNMEVAMPSLEVSLTDTQEQVVVRRVLTPAQFGASSGLLAANSDFANALTLQIQPDASLQGIAGYRLLAFYP